MVGRSGSGSTTGAFEGPGVRGRAVPSRRENSSEEASLWGVLRLLVCWVCERRGSISGSLWWWGLLAGSRREPSWRVWVGGDEDLSFVEELIDTVSIGVDHECGDEDKKECSQDGYAQFDVVERVKLVLINYSSKLRYYSESHATYILNKWQRVNNESMTKLIPAHCTVRNREIQNRETVISICTSERGTDSKFSKIILVSSPFFIVAP
ncbi:hypothetical protein IW261DRAFT_1422633 [Armillaria novae-zelandiae]|uniref:Uncharacterized protein n=1 Tax=Armillaria novae-zelandiae TaxID=153914 RepID=A0AA39U085_9AGAR|nr:hypothetical protein IW261DRAFT_1422633 [Armillaria novae-zelandiae]